jgi:rhodanese-related sulfurtransferase
MEKINVKLKLLIMRKLLLICSFAIFITAILACENTSRQQKENNLKTQQENIVINVSPKEAMKLIEQDNLIVIDVRTPEEYQSGHIPGAININVNDPSFQEKAKTIDSNKKILVYCRSGHRSTIASNQLKDLGFTKIYNLKGGIMAWEKENGKIEQ